MDLAIDALLIPIPDVQAERQRLIRALLLHLDRLDLLALLAAFSGGHGLCHLNGVALAAVRRPGRNIRIPQLQMNFRKISKILKILKNFKK